MIIDDDCAHNNDKEYRVIEEIFKHVDFYAFQFSSIECIEDLQKQEDIEIAFSGLIVAALRMDGGRNAKYFRTETREHFYL